MSNLFLLIILSISITSCGLIPNPQERMYLPSGALKEIQSSDSSIKFLEYRVNTKLRSIDGIVPFNLKANANQDIAVISNIESKIEIFRNISDGLITPLFIFEVCSGGGDLDSGDMDGNGFEDLVLICSTEPKIEIYYNFGKNELYKQSYPFTSSIIGTSIPSNYGQSGTNSLWILKDSPTSLDVYFKNVDGQFNLSKSLPSIAAPSGMVSGVFTKDGKESYAMVSERNSIFSLYIYNSNSYDRIDYNTLAAPSDFDVIDLRGNGYQDIIISSGTENIFRIYENNGEGRFANYMQYSIPGGVGSLIGQTRLRAQARSELVFQVNNTGELVIFPNSGLNILESPTTITLGTSYTNITTAALHNPQGDLDLIMSDSINNQIVIWLNQKQSQ